MFALLNSLGSALQVIVEPLEAAHTLLQLLLTDQFRFAFRQSRLERVVLFDKFKQPLAKLILYTRQTMTSISVLRVCKVSARTLVESLTSAVEIVAQQRSLPVTLRQEFCERRKSRVVFCL